MSNDPFYWSDGTRMAVVAGIVTVLVVLILGIAIAGVRTSESDRKRRTAEVESCATIENEALRTLCITK